MKKKLILLFIAIFVILIVLFMINYSNNDKNNIIAKVKGVWIADGTQYTFIIGYKDGKHIYSNNDIPFRLSFDGKGNYNLEMGEYVEIGTYSLNKANVVLKNEDGLITENCVLKNKIELHCNKYASLYIKE